MISPTNVQVIQVTDTKAKRHEIRMAPAEWKPGKVSATIQPGGTEYRIVHNLGTLDVIVQTRIAGRVRDGGISVLDENTVQISFGGVLNEPMDVVILG